MENTITESQAIVESEQNFCLKFFHINSDSESGQLTNDGNDDDSLLGGKTDEKRINGQLKYVMATIFDSLPMHVQKFISLCKEHHPSYFIFKKNIHKI